MYSTSGTPQKKERTIFWEPPSPVNRFPRRSFPVHEYCGAVRKGEWKNLSRVYQFSADSDFSESNHHISSPSWRRRHTSMKTTMEPQKCSSKRSRNCPHGSHGDPDCQSPLWFLCHIYIYVYIYIYIYIIYITIFAYHRLSIHVRSSLESHFMWTFRGVNNFLQIQRSVHESGRKLFKRIFLTGCGGSWGVLALWGWVPFERGRCSNQNSWDQWMFISTDPICLWCADVQNLAI